MSRTVTLRLDEPTYELFKTLAQRENRPLSNFIKNAVIRFVEGHDVVDDSEMAGILEDERLNQSLKRGHLDAKRRRGGFV